MAIPEERRVLVIDDDLMFTTRIANGAQAAGFNATVTANGEDAVGLARRLHPALVIINLASPRFDGSALSQELRRSPDTAAIPQLGYAGHREAAIRQQAADIGMDYVASNSEITSKTAELIGRLVGS